MRRVVGLSLAVGLSIGAVACGGAGGPRREIRADDQRRAQSIVVRQADLGPMWQVGQGPDLGIDPDLACAEPGLSGLVVNGVATAQFAAEDSTAAGFAVVVERGDRREGPFAALADADVLECSRERLEAVRGELVGTIVPLPVRAVTGVRSRGHRFGVTFGSRTGALDYILLHRGRAAAGLLLFGDLPTLRREERRLVGILARRVVAATTP